MLGCLFTARRRSHRHMYRWAAAAASSRYGCAAHPRMGRMPPRMRPWQACSPSGASSPTSMAPPPGSSGAPALLRAAHAAHGAWCMGACLAVTRATFTPEACPPLPAPSTPLAAACPSRLSTCSSTLPSAARCSPRERRAGRLAICVPGHSKPLLHAMLGSPAHPCFHVLPDAAATGPLFPLPAPRAPSPPTSKPQCPRTSTSADLPPASSLLPTWQAPLPRSCRQECSRRLRLLRRLPWLVQWVQQHPRLRQPPSRLPLWRPSLLLPLSRPRPVHQPTRQQPVARPMMAAPLRWSA